MDVVHGLPSFLPAVDDRAVAVCQIQLGGDFPHNHKQVPNQFRVSVFKSVQRDDLFLRDDEDMGGGQGTDISKGQSEFVFVNDLGRDFAVDDLCEDCRHENTVGKS